MAVIKKKIPPEYFDLVDSGKKSFEARVADFEVKEGDTIILEEYDPKTGKYTGRTIEREVGYVLDFDLDTFGQRDLIEKRGLVIFSLKNDKCNNDVDLGAVSREVFNKENNLCKKYFISKGHCCWGVCEKCGVPLLLHKLHKGEVVDKKDEVEDLKKRFFQ